MTIPVTVVASLYPFCLCMSVRLLSVHLYLSVLVRLSIYLYEDFNCIDTIVNFTYLKMLYILHYLHMCIYFIWLHKCNCYFSYYFTYCGNSCYYNFIVLLLVIVVRLSMAFVAHCYFVNFRLHYY